MPTDHPDRASDAAPPRPDWRKRPMPVPSGVVAEVPVHLPLNAEDQVRRPSSRRYPDERGDLMEVPRPGSVLAASPAIGDQLRQLLADGGAT